MASRISLVVNAQNPGNEALVYRFVQQAKPTTMTIMDGLGMCKQVKALSPDTIVVHRDYETYKGDDDLYKKITPEDWVQQQAAIREREHAQDSWAYAGNEQPFTQEVVSWNLRAARAAEKAGLRLVVGNWGVGKPENINDWRLAYDLLKYCGEHPDRLILGLHEYWWGVCTSGFVGGNPDGTVQGEPGRVVHPDFTQDWPANPRSLGGLWHCGRFLFAEQYCRENGINKPLMLITEHGADDVSDPRLVEWESKLKHTKPGKLRDWKSCAAQWAEWWPVYSTERAYFEQLRYLDTHLYQGTSVIGQQIFAFNPNWPHDISGATELIERLISLQATPPPDPPPIPDPPPEQPRPELVALRSISERLAKVQEECAIIQTELQALNVLLGGK